MGPQEDNIEITGEGGGVHVPRDPFPVLAEAQSVG